MSKKPMLACDYDVTKLRFPVVIQPKIDGVRAVNFTGILTGRSLKQHKNRYTTSLYSHPLLLGLDGELAAESEVNPALCRLTTSALNTIEGEPYTLWWLFDWLVEGVLVRPYVERYHMMKLHMDLIRQEEPPLWQHLRIVPSKIINTIEELNEISAQYDEMGYEGSILRAPYGHHKNGRSTVKEGLLLRVKNYIEEEALVVAIEEGQSNQNEATINALGHTERSSHQANMVPNGMVGALLCKDLKTGKDIRVSAGTMTHADRILYFQNPDLILQKIIKYKTFPKGVKDKPRHPTFQSIKMESDM